MVTKYSQAKCRGKLTSGSFPSFFLMTLAAFGALCRKGSSLSVHLLIRILPGKEGANDLRHCVCIKAVGDVKKALTLPTKDMMISLKLASQK